MCRCQVTDLLLALLLIGSLLSHDPVDINRAGERELETLPGIGPAKAAAIVEFRETYGPFLSVEDLEMVSGIGPSTMESLAGLVTVGDAAGALRDTSHWLPREEVAEPLLEVRVLDVGQGDAILLRARGGEVWLFDGGPDEGGPVEPAVVARLMAAGVDTLDVVALSHPHADHVGGLASVVRRFEVLRVLDPGMAHSSFLYEDFLEAVLEEGCDYGILAGGETFRLSEEVSVHVVSSGGGADPDVNEASAVLSVECGGFSMLLTGDIESDSQRELTPGATPVTVLKVPHHGSISSDFLPWARRVRPQLAVVSCGRDNPFGHPNPAILAMYGELGADILRTDLQGTIVLLTDGNAFSVTTRTGVQPGD